MTIEDPRSDQARTLLGAYLEDVVSRYHGRPLPDAELKLAHSSMPTDDLANLAVCCLSFDFTPRTSAASECDFSMARSER
jgi:hypothetical protein